MDCVYVTCLSGVGVLLTVDTYIGSEMVMEERATGWPARPEA